MKKLLCLFLASVFLFLAGAAACAESEELPTIAEALQAGAAEKTEVSDSLDGFSVFSESFEDFSNPFKALVLQREAPEKEFTARTVYPPFTDDQGFPNDFAGVDVSSPRVWLRADLMQQIPETFRATSLEDATYLFVADTLYQLDGSISETDYADSDGGELPEFETAEEMAKYLSEHPREVASITYHPKFCVYNLAVIYEVSTGRVMLYDYTVNPSMRFAKNPEAVLQLDNMYYIGLLLTALSDEMGPDPGTAINILNYVDFVPEDLKASWTALINAEAYPQVREDVTEYWWSMAEALKDLDPDEENKACYDLILSERNAEAFQLFSDYCEYGGFERSVTSIGLTKDYMGHPDPAWAEEKLAELLSIFE